MSVSDTSPPSSPGGSRSSFLTDNIREDASSHSGLEPMDEVAQYLFDARREEENNRPERWFNPDQNEEVNDKQDALHEDVLQEFCAMLCASRDDPHILDWSMRRSEVRYAIFHEVYVSVYEARKDVPYEDESWGELLGFYLAFFMGAVDSNTDRRPDPSMFVDNVPSLTPDRGLTPERYSPIPRHTPERGTTPDRLSNRSSSPGSGQRWLTPEGRIAFSRRGTPERGMSPRPGATPERGATPESISNIDWRMTPERRDVTLHGETAGPSWSPSSQGSPREPPSIHDWRMRHERLSVVERERTPERPISPDSQITPGREAVDHESMTLDPTPIPEHRRSPPHVAALVDGLYS